eukprot:TRINITY_DN4833_c0_g2_i3.p1 TRINITY_DN4833_c0_g2~~TRINITY_DN4833_c0_g2_i3.p1  ORF type:complete len:565 (-),score=93.85 TRINITY_DN4833_c0_g2_i3:82-1776(-)
MAKSLLSLLLPLQLLLSSGELTAESSEGLESCFVQTNVIVKSKDVNKTDTQYGLLASSSKVAAKEMQTAPKQTPKTFKEFEDYQKRLLSDRFSVRLFEWLAAIAFGSVLCFYLFGIVLPFNLGRRVAQANWILAELMKGVGFLVLLPVSYPFAQTLGKSAFMSGLLLSAWPLGGIVGQMGARRTIPEASQEGGNYKQLRTIIVWSQLLLGFSFFGYIAVVWSPLRQNYDLLWWTLIGLRTLSGVASGFNCLASSFMALNVTPPPEVMNLQTTVTGAKNFGLTIAVLISSIAMLIFGDDDIWLQGTVPLMLPFYMVMGMLLAFVLCMPLLEPSKDDFEASEEPGSPRVDPEKLLVDSLELEARKKLVDQALVFNYERALSVAAIEVCSSLISEAEYGFSAMTVGWIFGGITVGAGFLNFAIAKFMTQELHTRASAMFWQAFLGCFATMFIFNVWPWWTLYIADTFVFSFANAANGIANGFALLAAVPDSPYSKEAFMNKQLFAVSISRLLSAPLARGWYDLVGRNGYALAQFLITVVGLNGIRKMCVVLKEVQAPEEVKEASKVA